MIIVLFITVLLSRQICLLYNGNDSSVIRGFGSHEDYQRGTTAKLYARPPVRIVFMHQLWQGMSQSYKMVEKNLNSRIIFISGRWP